jgi:hypothetical protein
MQIGKIQPCPDFMVLDRGERCGSSEGIIGDDTDGHIDDTRSGFVE